MPIYISKKNLQTYFDELDFSYQFFTKPVKEWLMINQCIKIK